MAVVSRAYGRSFLLASAGMLSLTIADAAHAQTAAGNGPETSYFAPSQNVVPTNTINGPAGSNEAPSVVISQPGTPTTDQDPNDVTGIGEMIIDQQNGYIGLCTGTLINPRTVLFAAHCVNENPSETAFQDPWGYGTANGGLPIAFGFNQNNNGSNGAFGNWLYGGYQTSVASYLYNVNEVAYNPVSTQLGLGNNFYQGDVAIATLDTPAANVPTWAILLSQLPAPGSINGTSGTGYHVTIDGYGDNGVGNTGDNGQGVDFRRRVAENYIGMLGSLDDLDGFLFGSADGLPQNLYQLDFDDPRRGTASASPYDFNVFKDDALPNEGITAPGDSGGPLILDDTYDQKLVIAVLSGSDRFYAAQPSASYGTTSFYQPLYLWWQWIAANNNYHYVGTKAGDGNWNDPAHWVTNLDPNYMTIQDGNLVNGIPQYGQGGTADTSGKFGEICFEQPGVSDCYNVATGVETYNGTQIQYNPAGGSPSTLPIPDPTLDNGLPGATDFVPNDRDPDAASHTRAAYFDVTLGATGTTTLDSAVTVDRLSIIGSGAKLNVTNTGSLTSLMDITQTDGLVTDNGIITSVGDYLLMGGGLMGSGRINAPYFTSILGMIAPGTLGTTGTLTFGGNLILSSGNILMIDLGANGVSDKIAVKATQADADGNPLDGIASIGGKVGFSAANGYMIRAGDHYTILTADNSVTGTFETAALSAILTPKLTYTTNAVQVTIDAGLYADVVAGDAPVQQAYARLLDGDRAGSYNALSDIYGPLDLQDASTIRSTLDSWAPRTETLRTEMAMAALDNTDRFFRERLASLTPGENGGTLALMGQPLQLAAVRRQGLPGSAAIENDGGDPVLQQGKLPETMTGFLAGGYIDGNGAAMPTANPAGGRNQFDGFYVAGGLEQQLGSRSLLGIGLSYTDLDGHTAFAGQTASTLFGALTIYGKTETAGNVVIDAMASIDRFGFTTDRVASLAGTNYQLHLHDTVWAYSGELGIGKTLDAGRLTLTPRAALRGSTIDFGNAYESGGGPEMRYDRNHYDSIQGRLGATLAGGQTFKPFLSAAYVHDFADRPMVFDANFREGAGPDALFALAGRDHDWGEISGGVSFGNRDVQISLNADTTVFRSDVSNQSYRATLKFHF